MGIKVGELIHAYKEVEEGVKFNNFDFKKLGIKVGELIHAYKEVEEGVKFRTEMTIKCEVPVIGKLVTWIATKTVMHEKKIRAWMQHNIEESGESEHFIPKLYNHAQSKPL